MTQPPLFWIKNIEQALSTLQDIPLWGNVPAFPWEVCGGEIGALLQQPTFKLALRKTEFLDAHQLTAGLGNQPYLIPLTLSPLAPSFYWAMSQADVSRLTQLLMGSREGVKGFSSPKYQEGFYRYLMLNVLQIIDETHRYKDLSLRIAPQQSLPQEGALCADVSLQFSEETLWGRLICPLPFIEALKTHHANERPSLLSSSIAQQADLTLRLELGSTVIPLSQWKKVQAGDLLILDRTTYDPETRKGTAILLLEQTPLFRARFKEDHLKLVDYAYTHEDEHTMSHHSDDDEEDFEDFEEEHLDDEEDLDEEAEEENLEEEDAHEDEETEELQEEPVEEEETSLWTAEEPAKGVSEEMIATQEIPLTVTVELARLKMNLNKLLELSVGNLIELPAHPEQGVYLVVNGKRVAQGELVKMGDLIGVKILQLG